MAAGTMRDRVSLRSKTRTRRADGGFDTTLGTVSTVWAHIRPVQAREGEKAGRLFGDTTYIVEIYTDDRPTGLTTDWQLRWETAPGGAVDFDVVGIRLGKARVPTVEIIAASATPAAAEDLTPADTGLLWGGEALTWGGESIQWGA
jgi:head-tail adaptor